MSSSEYRYPKVLVLVVVQDNTQSTILRLFAAGTLSSLYSTQPTNEFLFSLDTPRDSVLS